MKRSASQKAIIAIALVIMSTYGIWRAISPQLARYLEEEITASVPRTVANISLRDINSRFIGLDLSSVSFFFPRAFFGLELTEVQARLSWGAIFRGLWGANLNAKAYNGTLQASFNQGILSAKQALSFSGEAIAVAQHPQLSALGFKSGILDFEAPRLDLAESAPEGRISLKLRGANKPGTTNLPPSITGFPFAVPIPPITDLSVTIEARMRDGEILIERGDCSSSLLKASGRGVILLDKNHRPARIEYRASITLSEAGKRNIGPYLGIISENRLTPDVSEFEVGLLGPWSNPDRTFRRLR